MAKYVMFGKYSLEAIKGITAERTKKAASLIEKAGGKINSMYVLLGRYDLVLIADFPDNKSALKAAVDLTKLTGVSFATSPAVTVEEFDKLVG